MHLLVSETLRKIEILFRNIGTTKLSVILGVCTLSLWWKLLNAYRRVKHFEKAYWGERRGRARVEQEMRNLAEIQLNTSEGFFLQPIGIIESCYKQCVGTPRQGMLVPSSRAVLLLSNNISPESLDGLEEFSHIWLTFKFHLNSNTLKEAKAFSGVKSDSKRYTFTGKVTPPMLKEKKGVLATRSPHRPNPIGVTLAKIDEVCKSSRCLRLSSCDLVHGTPILDIKPYVPAYDSVTQDNCRVPLWISETIYTRNKVSVIESARRQTSNPKQNYLILYGDNYDNKVLMPRKSARQKCIKEESNWKNGEEEFWKGLIETLEADVRSTFQTKRAIELSQQSQSSEGSCGGELPFDGALVRYRWIDTREIVITELVEPPKLLIPELMIDNDVVDKLDSEKFVDVE